MNLDNAVTTNTAYGGDACKPHFFQYLMICFVLFCFNFVLCGMAGYITLWRALETDLSGNLMDTIGGEEMAELGNFLQDKSVLGVVEEREG